MAQPSNNSAQIRLKELSLANFKQVDTDDQPFFKEEQSPETVSFFQAQTGAYTCRKMNYHDNHHNIVDEVVDRIFAELPSISMEKAANLSQDNFLVLELIVVSYIRHRIEQMDATVKKWVMEDCLKKFKEPVDEVDPATVIFRELWRRLWKTHKVGYAKWG